MGFSLLLHPDNRQVGQKLGLATGLMFTLPIISYYVALNYVFAGKDQPDNWAGGTAILVTNIIVAGYCYQAYIEDREEVKTSKDAAGPRVGAFKERTD